MRQWLCLLLVMILIGVALLAKECGAKVDEEQLRRVLVHWYRMAGRGNNSYRNNRPEGSFVDNGKNGLVAFAMAAAASLTPEGERGCRWSWHPAPGESTRNDDYPKTKEETPAFAK